jgi:hypothetical protein
MRAAAVGEPSMAMGMPTTTSEELPACTAVEMGAMTATTGTAQAQVALEAEEVAEATPPCFVGLDWGRVETREPVPMAEAAVGVGAVVMGMEETEALAAAGAVLPNAAIPVSLAAETEGSAPEQAMGPLLGLYCQATSEGILTGRTEVGREVPGRDWAAPSLAMVAA